MLNIRPASPNDLEAIQKLNHQVMARNIEFDPGINPNFDLEEIGKGFFKDLLENENGIFLIAMDGEQLVGYINGSPKEQMNRSIRTFEMENLGIIPDYRRQGLATKLYARFVEEVKQRGFTRIFLNCYIKNEIALDFYKKLGFEPIDVSLEKDI
jgi:ribosomal protein S18 acetylase RimI-like enzyme